MTTTAVDIGDQERLTCTFTDANGTLTDPTAITCTVTGPDGASTVYAYADSPATVVRSSTGVYYLDLTYTAPAGRWFVDWRGTGALIAAAVTERWVRRSNVA